MRSLVHLVAVATTATALTTPARAADEWRLLGPAFARHFSENGAQMQRLSASWQCSSAQVVQNLDGSGAVTSTSKSAARSFTVSGVIYAAQPWQNATGSGTYYQVVGQLAHELQGITPGPTTVNINGRSTRFSGQSAESNSYLSKSYTTFDCSTADNRAAQTRGWTQNNPAFGLERLSRSEFHVDSLFGTIVRDSYGTPSVMLGAGRQWPAASWASVTLDAGFVAGVWYRSEVTSDGYGLKRTFLPYVLPALRLSEEASGLGVNVALAPRVKVAGQWLSSTTTLMVQTSLRISERQSLSVNRDAANGHLHVTYARQF